MSGRRRRHTVEQHHHGDACLFGLAAGGERRDLPTARHAIERARVGATNVEDEEIIFLLLEALEDGLVDAAAPGEDEVIDGNAFAVVATPSLVLTNDDVTVTLRNATTRLEFEDASRTDRWQNAARLSVSYRLPHGTTVTAFGERSDNILAAEFTSTDEWEYGGEIEHSFNEANRVQLGASYAASQRAGEKVLEAIQAAWIEEAD